MTYAFADPLWLLFACFLPIVAWFRGRRAINAIAFPFSGSWKRSTIGSSSKLPTILAYIGTILLIVSLARPQKIETEKQSKSKGYDIILAIDISTSMLNHDDNDRGTRSEFNRLQIVKPILNAFIDRRENDRIGLVAFSGRAYTMAPLTFDHDWLQTQTDRLYPGLIEDGTAIGDALAVAVTRLQEGAKEQAGEREGAFAVLLTDGENTLGLLSPLEAADIAAKSGIRVFTIGAGSDGLTYAPRFNREGKKVRYDRVQSRIDSRTLNEMARKTKGSFFRAENKSTIEEAFESIDATNKIEFEVNQYSVTTELFPYSTGSATAFLLVAILLSGYNRKVVAA